MKTKSIENRMMEGKIKEAMIMIMRQQGRKRGWRENRTKNKIISKFLFLSYIRTRRTLGEYKNSETITPNSRVEDLKKGEER